MSVETARLRAVRAWASPTGWCKQCATRSVKIQVATLALRNSVGTGQAHCAPIMMCRL